MEFLIKIIEYGVKNIMTKPQKRNFWLYAIGRLVSLIGSGVQAVALPLYVLDKTGSGSMMGIFAMLSMVPAFLMTPFAGVIGDRWNRKRIMVNMDYARGVIIFLLAFFAFTNKLNISILFTMQVFISVMNSVFGSATAAMMPDLLPEEKFTWGNSVMATVQSLSGIIGPALGGIIYGILGIEWVFMINAISFVLSAVSEMFIIYRVPHDREKEITLKIFVQDIKEGLNFMWMKKTLLSLVMLFMVLNFLAAPIFIVALPYILREIIGFSAQQFGYIETSWTLGTLLGSIMVGTFLSKFSLSKLFKAGLLTMVYLTIGFSIEFFPFVQNYFNGPTWSYFFLIAVSLLVMGVFNSMLNIPINTYLQKLTTPNIRSRVFSVVDLLTQLAVPVGSLIYGVLLDKFPSHLILLVITILLTIISTVYIFNGPKEILKEGNVEVQ